MSIKSEKTHNHASAGSEREKGNIWKKSFIGKVLPYLLVLPLLLLVFLTIVYPMFVTLLQSVSKVSRIGKIQSIGYLGNYKSIFQYDGLGGVIWQTSLWVIVTVGVAFVLAYLLALLLNNNFRFRGLAYMLVILPWAAPLSIATLCWMWIFHGELGPLNQILKYFHIINANHHWLGTPSSAMITVLVVGIWSNISFIVVTLLAGLQSIGSDIYEASSLDGAGPVRTFFKITWPLMRSVNQLVIVLSVLWSFNAFPIIWILTKGGPANSTDTLVTLIYKLSFVQIDFGQAAAFAAFTFFIMVIFTVVYFVISGGEDKS
ncbi:multiple sugar transport system permease protein [Paenibacillus sp. yr247]|uniref:carbohydrate ABC transporter permease n=1 Tax=Paenibacillus sp. yr247 TaxID=1761880 RepID=UPI000883F2CE|nr:sugar ABC transporter permease [Paenibacillus sp. yr247]SDP09450.1 multiple sugar transport system permease protein [Paenibacillus sp. yr247]